MKSTGFVRRVDELGRLVLPMELRRDFDIEENDMLEIGVGDDTILLRKYEPKCIFCNGTKNVEQYKGKNICNNCMDNLRNLT